MLRTYTYTGGYFEVEDLDGDLYEKIPISFQLFLAPDADRCHLEEAGKILSVFIANSFGEDHQWN